MCYISCTYINMVNTTCMMKLKEILHAVWDVGGLHYISNFCLHVSYLLKETSYIASYSVAC